jgi:hypothetical protein
MSDDVAQKNWKSRVRNPGAEARLEQRKSMLQHLSGRGLLSQEVTRMRSLRAAEIAGRYASVLTGKQIQGTLEKNLGAPAKSTTTEVFLDEQLTAGLVQTPKGVVVLRGLTLHETGHLLYTPRAGTHIKDFVQDNGLGEAYNILEDGRLERLLIARFGDDVKAWLSGTVAQLLLESAETHFAWPLIAGRTYLPANVRQSVKDCFQSRSISAQKTSAEYADEMDAIAVEYSGLVLPLPGWDTPEQKRAHNLVLRFQELLGETGLSDNNGDGTGGSQNGTVKVISVLGCGGLDADRHGHASPGTPPQASRAEQEELQKKAEQQSKSNRSPSTASASPGKNDTKDADEDRTQEPGETSVSRSRRAEVQLHKLNIETQDALQKQISRVFRELNEPSQLVESPYTPEKLPRVRMPRRLTEASAPRPQVRLASKRFGRELEQLKADLAAQWLRNTRNGKLNAARYLRGASLHESFDRWLAESDDVLDMEVVLLLDRSGSMSSYMRAVNESAWAIKSALDRIQVPCTAVYFDSETELLYAAEEPAGKTVSEALARGGTDPLGALLVAKTVFARSTRQTRVLLTLTDGAWNSESMAEETVKELTDSGVVTMLTYLGNSLAASAVNAHEHEMTSLIQSASDLFVVARGLVRYAAEIVR